MGFIADIPLIMDISGIDILESDSYMDVVTYFNMKAVSIIIIFLTFFSVSNGQISTNCLPDKGIKIAKTFAQLESNEDETNTKNNNFQEVQYNVEGRVILIKESRDEYENRREYIDGKLQLMISTRKELPDFYSTEDFDSLTANASEVTDTAIVVRHKIDGQPAELKHADGSSQIFEYNGCREESHTFLNSDGDTIQVYQTIFENGVVIKTIWTPFKPVKSVVTTEYFDYEFNRQGHWTERKYRRREGIVIEWRKLTYY